MDGDNPPAREWLGPQRRDSPARIGRESREDGVRQAMCRRDEDQRRAIGDESGAVLAGGGHRLGDAIRDGGRDRGRGDAVEPAAVGQFERRRDACAVLVGPGLGSFARGGAGAPPSGREPGYELRKTN